MLHINLSFHNEFICWIGAKVSILDGAIIGDNCIVVAGAVVKGEFPANSTIGGVPAKILKMRT